MRFFSSIDRSLRSLRAKFAPLIYRGNAFFCPACNKNASRFKPAGKGKKARENAVCPFCRARERDRLVILFLKKNPNLFPPNPPHLLHVAPEPSISAYLKNASGNGYLSADIYRDDVMEKMDITHIQKPDNHFGAIFCSHVLQDIPDDNIALRELYRVLAPGGWAILNVPFYKGTKTTTLEAIHKTGRPPEFFRDYGDDYVDQLQTIGFEVQEIPPAQLRDPNMKADPAIDHPMTGYIHFCRKPST